MLMFYLIKKNLRRKMKRILNQRHIIGSYVINKISLSCYNDKRFILKDGINSLYIKIKIHKNIIELS